MLEAIDSEERDRFALAALVHVLGQQTIGQQGQYYSSSSPGLSCSISLSSKQEHNLNAKYTQHQPKNPAIFLAGVRFMFLHSQKQGLWEERAR